MQRRASCSKMCAPPFFPFCCALSLAMNATAQHAIAASACAHHKIPNALILPMWVGDFFFHMSPRLWFKLQKDCCCGPVWTSLKCILCDHERSPHTHTRTRLTLFKWSARPQQPITSRHIRKQSSHIDWIATVRASMRSRRLLLLLLWLITDPIRTIYVKMYSWLTRSSRLIQLHTELLKIQ